VALAGHRQKALALQRMRRFVDGHIPEEGAQRGKAHVPCPRAVAAVNLQMPEELAHERGVELFDPQLGWFSLEAFRGEAQQQPEGVAVGGDHVRTRVELGAQTLREEALEPGGQVW